MRTYVDEDNSASKLHVSLEVAKNAASSKYPAKSHARNVAKQLDITEGLIYLCGEVSRDNEDSDMAAFWRQKRYFYYLTGFDLPDAHVTYDIGTDTLTLWIERPDPREKLWSGPSPTPSSLLQTHDIDMANYTTSLSSTITAYAISHPSTKIHILHAYYPPISPSLHSHCDNTLLQYSIDVCRVIKDPHEITLIRTANEISTHAHMKIMANIDMLTSEREIEGLFIEETIKRGGRLAYDTIACSGRNCAILHYMRNDQDLAGKELVLIDAGAEYGLYASDVTRTYPIKGRFSKEGWEIYELVYRMQAEVFGMVKPGVRFRDLYLRSVEVAVEGLVGLGILKGEVGELVDSGVLGRVFFPHGLGHHVGLEVHDTLYGELISRRVGVQGGNGTARKPKGRRSPVISLEEFEAYLTREIHNHLQPGMVFTVEPGIYFNRPLYEDYLSSNPEGTKFIDEKVLEKYWDVGGVRIEDCILVTENGFENLTGAPKERADVERIIRMKK
ncbi:hypothetical protein ABW19_dt0209400 [Dactylella cylindrospora]|nr:hypothetical protein ABW19_dt0209400 [Dactylella cylindrospora]